MAGFDLPSLDDDDGVVLSPKVSKSSDDFDYFESERKRRKKKASIAGGVVASAVALAVAGLLVFDPFGGDVTPGAEPQATQSAPAVADDPLATKLVDDKGNVPVDFWQTSPDSMYPVKLESWQKTPSSTLDSQSIEQSINATYKKGEFGHSTNRLPGKSNGFTSDESKSTLPDGTLNPMYSYVTAEDYRVIVGGYIERLINPVFGDWKKYQYSSDNPIHEDPSIEKFDDMFTTSWVKENLKKNPREYLPIYADWDNNDYGMRGQLLDSGPRWIGKVESSKTTMTYNEDSLNYDSKIVLNVKYSAWLKDQSVATKDGVLTLDVVTNTSDNNKPKLLIKNATLQVK